MIEAFPGLPAEGMVGLGVGLTDGRFCLFVMDPFHQFRRGTNTESVNAWHLATMRDRLDRKLHL